MLDFNAYIIIAQSEHLRLLCFGTIQRIHFLILNVLIYCIYL